MKAPFRKASVTRIGLVVSQNLSYCRGVLRGIKEFAETRPGWVLMPIAPEPRTIRALAELQPDGIIAHLFSTAVARAAQELGRPLVNVSGAMRSPPLPRVGTDDVRCGTMAARHFLDLGFRNFGFVGHWDHQYSVERERGFREAMSAAGFEVRSFHAKRGQPFEPIGRLWSLDPLVRRWLLDLPRPAAVFACNDIWGLQLTDVCRQSGLRVPEDVAILGVDNDDLLCGLARPPLSSLVVPGEQVGMEAAALLDRLLNGRPAPREPRLLPPSGVVQRRSTDVLAIDDQEVAEAVRFIRNHAHQPLSIGDVLAEVSVSRRSLERRFRSVLGRSPLDEIRRVHIEQASRLLAETELSMPAVAARAGFTDAKQLSIVFHQITGMTPTEYRRGARSGRSWMVDRGPIPNVETRMTNQ